MIRGEKVSKLSLFFYSLSVVVTIIICYLINYLTEPVLAENSKSNISNGNPGLFPLIFLTPFLLILIVGTFKVTYTFAKRTLQTIQFKIIIVFSLIVSSIIYFFTFKEAQKLRLLIFDNNDSVTKIDEIPLLNIYSNSTFFNGWTLIALLFTIIFIAHCSVLMKQKIRKYTK
ncbi:hypothetical protein P9B03_19220 [Metasolibacillus meyeri]|uniref:DUF2975 domain-containing protein n=1 Tax=Metasolibacillus meyeri TaxID=1071052 RepID=A0AAW9NVK1_9BACL|nr:hypothetical protein [Metasolibacillus meyeri]MEC1180597.1 hypothetical protein [Metasolibacillus meyeri]